MVTAATCPSARLRKVTWMVTMVRGAGGGQPPGGGTPCPKAGHGRPPWANSINGITLSDGKVMDNARGAALPEGAAHISGIMWLEGGGEADDDVRLVRSRLPPRVRRPGRHGPFAACLDALAAIAHPQIDRAGLHPEILPLVRMHMRRGHHGALRQVQIELGELPAGRGSSVPPDEALTLTGFTISAPTRVIDAPPGARPHRPANPARSPERRSSGESPARTRA